jgi:hypothetical protein
MKLRGLWTPIQAAARWFRDTALPVKLAAPGAARSRDPGSWGGKKLRDEWLSCSHV